jgi:hypothetical protein
VLIAAVVAQGCCLCAIVADSSDVGVTGWSEAPIPWPLCGAVERPCARAVRSEIAAAMRHW